MSKSRKKGKQKPNHGNQVKRQNVIKSNEQILAKLK
jgi:hypothetical protein